MFKFSRAVKRALATYLVMFICGLLAGCDDSAPKAEGSVQSDFGVRPDLSMMMPDALVIRDDAEPLPELIVDSPVSGEFYSPIDRDVQVTGRLIGTTRNGLLTINGSQVLIDQNGDFRAPVPLTRGVLHVDVRYEEDEARFVETRRSVLVGADTPWDAEVVSAFGLLVNPSTMMRLSEALEGAGARQLIEMELIEGTAEDSDLQITEVAYSDIDVDLSLDTGFIRARIRLDQMAIGFAYNYELGGLETQVEGTLRANPALLEADVYVVQDEDGNFQADVRNPQLTLTDFELELEELYAFLEPIIEPIIRAVAENSLLSLLDDYLVSTIVDAELFDREIDVLGTPVGLKFALRDIFIGPDKATAVASGRIDGVMPVKEGPGIWQAGGSATPDQGPHDLSLNVGIDILNHLLAHIWRGGLLDTSFEGTDPDSPTASITMGILAGFASQTLLDTFPADAPLTIRLDAFLQPIVRFVDQGSTEIALDVGALRIALAAPDMNGQTRDWGTLEVSGRITVTPSVEGLSVTLGSQSDLRFEVIDEPVVPLQEAELGSFLETIVGALIGSALDSAIGQIIDLDSLDLFGLRYNRFSWVV